MRLCPLPLPSKRCCIKLFEKIINRLPPSWWNLGGTSATRPGTESDDAATPLVTTAEGPNAAMLYSDEGVAQRIERALDENAAESGADQPRRQSTRLSRANTGGETAGTSIDLRDTETLSKIQQCIPDGMWTSITSGKRNITVMMNYDLSSSS